MNEGETEFKITVEQQQTKTTTTTKYILKREIRMPKHKIKNT